MNRIKSIRIVGAIVAIIAATTGAGASVAGAAPASGKVSDPLPKAGITAYQYSIANANSGKCLEVAFGGMADFNVASQYTCYGGPVQKWTLTYIGPGYTLTNVNGGRCLEIGFGGLADFNVANQYSCYGGAVQQWTLTYIGPGYTLTNVNSGKCLEIGFGGMADFNVANQYTCYGGPVQQWIFS